MRYGVFVPSMLVSYRVPPERNAAAHERQVDAGVARGFDVAALRVRPVRVVSRRDEDLVLADPLAGTIGVDAGHVGDVVAVALEPPHQRVLTVEELLGQRAVAIERAVVADFEGARPDVGRPAAARGAAERRERAVEACATVAVEGDPRWIGRLHDHVRSARIVSDDEDDVARTFFFHRVAQRAEAERSVAVGERLRLGRRRLPITFRAPGCRRVVLADETREVDARHRVGGHGP